MALEQYGKINQSDVQSIINTVNSTLYTYGFNPIDSISTGQLAKASLIQDMITKLKNVDSSYYNSIEGYYYTTLTNNNVSTGDKILTTQLSTIANCATTMERYYCPCDCNNSCRCVSYVSCSCDSQVACYCNENSEHLCFLPNTLILTSLGFKEVQDLKVGDFVFNQKGEFSQITSTWELNVFNHEIIEYYDNYLNISLTKNHIIPLKDNHFLFFNNNFKIKNKILFRKNIFYPNLFIKNLPLIFNNLIKIDNGNVYIKKDNDLFNILKQSFPNIEYINIFDEIYLINGLYKDFPISQFFNCFKGENNFIFPWWIYKLNYDIILYWFNTYPNINNNQLNLLFDIYNLRSHSSVQQKIKIYTGKVHNFTCDDNHRIFSTMIIGDGYSGT